MPAAAEPGRMQFRRPDYEFAVNVKELAGWANGNRAIDSAKSAGPDRHKRNSGGSGAVVISLLPNSYPANSSFVASR
jgi:hypothetical protein